ncbi:hypothetical protein C8J57DRAFT_1240250 [Mycena rebaudengoi]|nr:hypothetical protein C8J57DRAFT_1240250 [Mycena rebaudengoi]
MSPTAALPLLCVSAPLLIPLPLLLDLFSATFLRALPPSTVDLKPWETYSTIPAHHFMPLPTLVTTTALCAPILLPPPFPSLSASRNASTPLPTRQHLQTSPLYAPPYENSFSIENPVAIRAANLRRRRSVTVPSFFVALVSALTGKGRDAVGSVFWVPGDFYIISPRVNRPVSPPQSTDMCTISFAPYVRVSLPFSSPPIVPPPRVAASLPQPLIPAQWSPKLTSTSCTRLFSCPVSRRKFIPLRLLKSTVTAGLYFKSHRALLT